MKRIFQSIIIVAMLVMSVAGASAANPKHEFRGAWLHIIGQGQYAKQSTAENKAYLIKILDQLKASGCNAVIWQIRPQADAAYVSDIEPWSRWITGTAGKAPDPLWDPLQFMIDECHKRGMELHAWINPYRVTSGSSDKPAKGHVYYEHPEWFVKYADGKIYFDPGLPESRNFIDKVVRDILTRYDVDAIHMDDYFYPYPKDDVPFPDQKSFEKYGAGFTNKGDWRRHNVDLLIEQLHNTIHELKPWVQFGISPFGIWRNKKNDPDGSDTNGLQCYDALYADCPSWTAKGWVDYMVPQLYWELEHKRASTLELAYWWDRHANGRHMYYGQDVMNIMKHPDIAADGGDPRNPTQLDHKFRLMRKLEHVQGPCWWPGYPIASNSHGVRDSLANNQQSTPALIPAYTWLDNVPPAPIKHLTLDADNVLRWEVPATNDPMQQAVRFVVYRFRQGSPVNIEDANSIVAITGEQSYKLPNDAGNWQYAVSAVDRCNNESRAVRLQSKNIEQ